MKWAVILVLLAASCASSAGPMQSVVRRRPAAQVALDELASARNNAALARAVRELGRQPFPEQGDEVTRALLERLFDTEGDVRAEAAFALGLRGDPRAGDKLVFVALDHHEADRDALVRARAIEALSKLARPDLHERVLEALDDSDPRVRCEAAVGASRWPAAPGVVNQRLIEQLAHENDPSVVRALLFALDRRQCAEALDALLRCAKADDAEQRIYVARGLKHSIEAPKALEAALGALSDSDARVAYEAALTLGRSRSTKAFDALAAATGHENAHVRRGAWEALNTWRATLEHRNQIREVVEKLPMPLVESRLASERSSSVRIAMLASLLPLIEQVLQLEEPDAAFDGASMSIAQLEGLVNSERDWIGVAQGLARCRHPDSVRVLAHIATLEPLAVREAALEALAGHKGEAARAVLLTHLADTDNGVRLSAVLALVEMLEPGDLEALERCYSSCEGDGTPEVRFNIVKVLPALGGDAARALAERALFDEHAYVRRVARESYAQLAGKAADASLLGRSLAHVEQARPSVDSAALSRSVPRPRVRVETTKGAMVFELFAEETPAHVLNFLTLAERDYYDGLDFHRVVPDFVIQGGCYRGDGNGGGTWRGRDDALEHEISPRKYVRGSLGMPRWDDVDSGGSQFFVTHRATPHLDGRYTIFGELREGFDVLDAIDVGDKIVDVVLVRD